jgi:outer membrane protein assembly factor BamB
METVSGLMAITVVLDMTTNSELVPMILPTVMIPLTLVSVGFSVVATFIAGLFGIQLKLEGPRKLLEVLLNPKVLASAFVLNALVFGCVYSWRWWVNYPRLISTIESESKVRAKASAVPYEDVPTVPVHFTANKNHALLPQDLEQVWHVETGKGSFRAAVVSHDRVFFGNKDGVIRELELATGKEVRNFYVGTTSNSELTIWNNALYTGEGVHDTHHARIYRFDLGSGEYKGSYQTKGHTEAQAVVGSFEGENTLFVVGGVDGLHAVDPMTMKEKWKVNVGHIDAAVAVDGGTVFIGTGREKDDDKKNKCFAAAIDFKSGEVLWKRELAGSSWMRPVVAGNNICYVSGEVYFPTERGHITCFDKKTGDHTAAMNSSDPLVSTSKVLDNSILYTSFHGSVCRFDLDEKRNLWCFHTQSKEVSMAGASYDSRGHIVLYPSVTNGLYVLDADNGKVLKHWKPSPEEGAWKKIHADVTVAGDYWIVTDHEGSIRALRASFVPKTVNK